MVHLCCASARAVEFNILTGRKVDIDEKYQVAIQDALVICGIFNPVRLFGSCSLGRGLEHVRLLHLKEPTWIERAAARHGKPE